MFTRYKPSTKYGVSEKSEFAVYEKVFARMKSYPPWPAKIMPQKFEVKKKSILSTCIVFFYGTEQIGECQFVDIFDFEENKERFRDVCNSSKSMKRPFEDAFNKAEEDDGSTDDYDIDYSNEVVEFEAPVNILLEREQKKVIDSRKRRAIQSVEREETSNRDEQNRPQTEYSSQEDDDSIPDDTADEEEGDNDDDDDDFEMSRRTRSRSQSRGKKRKGAGGRKRVVGRKRARRGPKTDENSDPAGGQTYDPSNENDLTGVVFLAERPMNIMRDYILRDLDVYDSNFRAYTRCEAAVACNQFISNTVAAHLPSGQIVEFHVRPKTAVGSAALQVGPYASHTASDLSTITARVEELEQLKKTLEKGRPIPPEYSTLVAAQLTPEHQAQVRARRAKQAKFLRVEAALLNELYRIKNSLSMSQVNFAITLSGLDKIMNMDVKPLMLKKNPHMVAYFRKIQNYDVSVLKTCLPPQYRETFESTAALIRAGADAILEQWAALFEFPAHVSFFRAFYLEVIAFIAETRGVPRADVLMLTDEITH